MCHECKEIDGWIAHYRRLAVTTGETESMKSIEILIAELQARKRTLHAKDDLPATNNPLHSI
jgi:hypothetical protein